MSRLTRAIEPLARPGPGVPSPGNPRIFLGGCWSSDIEDHRGVEFETILCLCREISPHPITRSLNSHYRSLCVFHVYRMSQSVAHSITTLAIYRTSTSTSMVTFPITIIYQSLTFKHDYYMCLFSKINQGSIKLSIREFRFYIHSYSLIYDFYGPGVFSTKYRQQYVTSSRPSNENTQLVCWVFASPREHPLPGRVWSLARRSSHYTACL